MKKSLKHLLIIAVICLSSANLSAQAIDPRYESIFIYNFMLYMEWPVMEKSGNFIIGILGKSQINTELSKMARLRTINGRKIEIKEYNSPDQIDKCHFFFVTRGESQNIEQVLNKVSEKNTMVIGESPGMIKKGAHINFMAINNKVKFELSKSCLKNLDIKVSSSLMKLAVLVN